MTVADIVMFSHIWKLTYNPEVEPEFKKKMEAEL
jgi:hypothetical protein